MRWWLWYVALSGCGRVGFDGRIGVDGRVDAVGIPAACARNASVADPITITGSTFRYMNFDNTLRTMLSGVTVQALALDATVVATATSDAMGGYTLSVPTGGTPPTIVLAYALANHFQTEITLDEPVDRNVSGANAQVWTVGDGPLWNLAAMTSFYSAAGTTRDTTKGTLNIAVRDCSGQPAADVTVAISPAPELVLYQTDGGSPAPSSGTQPRFATTFGINAQPGPNTITASGGGLTFAPVTVDVVADQANTLVILHAQP